MITLVSGGFMKKESQRDKEIAPFNEWCNKYEEELTILWAETGADREACFNVEDELEKAYENARKLFNKERGNHGK